MIPKISVYITSYNQEKYLPEAIDSVINQTLKPFEVLIIDDASTDNSTLIIQSYLKKFPQLVKAIFNKHNIGISKCRNIALNEFSGDYLTYLDGDDFFDKKKLELEYEAIRVSKKKIVFSNFEIISEVGDHIHSWVYDKDLDDIYKKALLREFPQNSLYRYELFSREVIDNAFYDESLEIYEDYDFKLNYLLLYSPHYTSFVGSSYRKHDQGLSKSPSKLHLKSLVYIYSKKRKKLKETDISGMNNSIAEYDMIINEKLIDLYWQLAVNEKKIYQKFRYLVKFLIQKLI